MCYSSISTNLSASVEEPTAAKEQNDHNDNQKSVGVHATLMLAEREL